MPKSGLVTEGQWNIVQTEITTEHNVTSLKQAWLGDLHRIVGRPMKNVLHDSNKLNSEIFCSGRWHNSLLIA